jgi:large subunit ribosomal protein L9
MILSLNVPSYTYFKATNMKVILLKNISHVGSAHDIKNVASGYAANYLFPRRLAEPYSKKREDQIEKVRKSEKEALRLKSDLLERDLMSLSGSTVELRSKANEKGHLFRGIHESGVKDAVLTEKGIDLQESAIVLESPVKEIGQHEVKVEQNDKSVTFTLNVVST